MSERKVYVIQEIPGTQAGNPKINIMGASKYGELKFLLPELSQIIFSPGPLIFKLRKLLKDFTAVRIIFLGDLFHSEQNNEWYLFESWVKKQNLEIILIEGNHDIIPKFKYNSTLGLLYKIIRLSSYEWSTGTC